MPQGISGASITGFDQVIKNLNAEILAIGNNTKKGLIKVSVYIYRDMETNQPLIPVEFGPLRASWETHMVNDGSLGNRSYGLRMGFAANYALWVHEMYGAVNWTRPGSGPGFFIKSINRNHDVILQIIAAETNIP